MFMMSFRMKRSKLLIGGVAAALVLMLGTGLMSNFPDTDSVEADAAIEKTEKTKKSPGKSNEERLAFAAAYGWETEKEPAEIIEVIIPKEFDSVYEQYNSIQKKQGLDLLSLAGKRCKRYSYVVTNYPGTESPVRINMLVYKDKIVGGDVCSLEAGGFVHGFKIEIN